MAVYMTVAQARRHHPRHEPLARRAPHARPPAELLRHLLQGRGLRRAQGGRAIDYEAMAALAREHRPKIVVVGASAYPRTIDFAAVRKAADECGRGGDGRHRPHRGAGGGRPPSVPGAARRVRDHDDAQDAARPARRDDPLPGEVGEGDRTRRSSPACRAARSMHIIAAKAVAFGEALHPEFKDYQPQILANAKALAGDPEGRGLRLVSGGTDNHLMLVDVFAQGHHGQGGGEGARPAPASPSTRTRSRSTRTRRSSPPASASARPR